MFQKFFLGSNYETGIKIDEIKPLKICFFGKPTAVEYFYLSEIENIIYI